MLSSVLGSNTNLISLLSSEDASGFFVSLLFGLGPLLGGVALVAFALTFHLQHALLTGVASGVAFVLGAWRPLQLLLSSKIGFFPLLLLLLVGSAFVHISISSALTLRGRKRSSADSLSLVTRLQLSALTLQSILCCSVLPVAFSAFVPICHCPCNFYVSC